MTAKVEYTVMAYCEDCDWASDDVELSGTRNITPLIQEWVDTHNKENHSA